MPRPGTSLLATLIDQLPATAPVPGWSISLPREVLASTHPATAGTVYDSSPAPFGPLRQQLRALEAVLSKPRIRGGQIVANMRDGTGKRRRSRPVEWFDTEAGRWTARLLPAPDGGEHLTVCPADRARITAQLTEMFDDIGR